MDTLDDYLNREQAGGATATPRTGGVTGNAGSTADPNLQTTDTRAGIANAYRQYLGRDIKDYEYDFWTGNPNYVQGIAGSAEAKARATGQPQARTAPPPGFDERKWNDPNHQTDKYIAGRIGAGGGSIDQILQALNANGTKYRKVSEDKVIDQLGDVYDLAFDVDNVTGQRRPQWTLVGGPTWERDNGGSSALRLAASRGWGAGIAPPRTGGNADTALNYRANATATTPAPPPATAPATVGATSRDFWANPTLNRIADAFRARGITPTQELVSQWGNNIDANYEAKIMASIAQLAPPAAEPPPANAGTDSGGEFTDPWGSAFERAINERLAQLENSPDRTQLDAFMARLLEADQNKQQNTDAFVRQIQGRIGELQQPVYSAGDEATIRAKAFDALERRRQQTLQNEREQVYARGFAPTSGIVQQATADTNQAFEQSRTGIESDLALSAIQETQRRRDQALQLNQLIEQALSGGDLASLQMLATASDLENNVYEQDQARAREVLSTLGLPLDLIMQRAQLGNQTAAASASPSDVISSLVALFSQNNTGRQNNVANMQNNMAGLGQTLAILAPLLNRRSA